MALWLYYDHNGGAVFGICAAAFHECGHLLALWLFRETPRGIRIGALGASIERAGSTRLSYAQELLAAAAGPAANLLLAAVLAMAVACRPALHAAVRINLLLAAFNLLPLRGLDGGQILLAALCTRCLPYRAERLAKKITVGAAMALTAISIVLVRNGYGSYALLLSSASVLGGVLP